MSPEIKKITTENAEDYIRTMFWSTGLNPSKEFIQEQINSFELQRGFGAFEGKKCVGTVGTRTLSMSVNGEVRARMAGIGQGGVLPTHTRRGIMGRLMDASLKDALDMNEDIAGWTTSEWSIYEKYRPGLATYSASYRIDGISRNLLKSGLTSCGYVEMVNIDEILPKLEELHKKCSNKIGNVTREQKYWDRLINRLIAGKGSDLLDARSDHPRPLCVIVTDGEHLQGCCIYRIHQVWESNLFNSTLEIIHIMGAEDCVLHSLWDFLFKTDLVSSIIIPHAPVNYQLRWLLCDGRRLKTTGLSDHIWIRILRPKSFLEKMKFPATDAPVVFEVHDDYNLIDIKKFSVYSDGNITVVNPSSDKANITLGVDTLASIILGGNKVGDFYKLGKINFGKSNDLLMLQTLLLTDMVPFTDTSF